MSVQVARRRRPTQALHQPTERPAPVRDGVVAGVERGGEARQHGPRPEQPANGQGVEDLEHGLAAGAHPAIAMAASVDRVNQRVVARHLAQVGALVMCRRVLQRDEFEAALPIEHGQHVDGQRAEATVAVVQHGQPSWTRLEEGPGHASMLASGRIAYDQRIMRPAQAPANASDEILPATDPMLARADLNLAELEAHWAPYASRRPTSAEQMRGADRRAQRLGVPVDQLMEQAGAAVAAAARAVLNSTDRPASGIVLLLAGPGNNGGDAFVAARHLAAAGLRTVVALVTSERRPNTPEATRNWRRLDGLELVERMHAASAHDVAMLLNGLERASLVVDGLLGTGVRGALRDPVREAVELCLRARQLGVPVLAIDTPTAVDLSSGQPSEPAVRADVTVTFHRPKEGLRTRIGGLLAGKVLVAPIGIPPQADVN